MGESSQQFQATPQEKWGQSALRKEIPVAAPASAPPEKTFEEEFPTLAPASVTKSAGGGWGKQSMADKVRQKLQDDNKEEADKEDEEVGIDLVFGALTRSYYKR